MDTVTDIAPDTFDALVKLAAFGCSGIAVLAVFLGYKLVKITVNASDSAQRTVKLYLCLCALMALVSGLSAVLDFTAVPDHVADTRQAATAAKSKAEEAELRAGNAERSLRNTQNALAEIDASFGRDGSARLSRRQVREEIRGILQRHGIPAR